MFRPCIDLHNGQVKQIVGGTLDDNEKPDTNFVSDKDSAYYASLYRRDQVTGGHVIKLGPGNEEAAKEALKAWPGGLQIGGGINAENAKQLNIVRYSGGLGLIAFAVFTEFNGFFAFGLVEIGLAVVTGSQIKKEEEASGSSTTEEL